MANRTLTQGHLWRSLSNNVLGFFFNLTGSLSIYYDFLFCAFTGFLCVLMCVSESICVSYHFIGPFIFYFFAYYSDCFFVLFYFILLLSLRCLHATERQRGCGSGWVVERNWEESGEEKL